MKNNQATLPFEGDDPDAVIAQALSILEARLKGGIEPNEIRETFTSPEDTKNYLKLRLAEREDEYFVCLYLDKRHRLIACEELFRGTLDGCSVYPRVVVKEALRHNAAAVVFGHNHPSGVAQPSDADRRLTERLRDALSLVEIRTLDHLVVGQGEVVSFAERGYI